MVVMTGQRKNLTAEIIAEIIRAIERLGVDSKTLPEAPSTRTSALQAVEIGSFCNFKIDHGT
jgi:hypothetical protein